VSDSVRLTLLKAVQAAIQGISIAGGYHFDVLLQSVVLDPTNIEVVPTEQTPFFVVGAWEPVERRFATSRPTQLAEKAKLTIFIAVDSASADTAAKATAWENVLADLEVAFAATITRLTLNGAVEYVKVLQPSEPGYGLQHQTRVLGMQPLELAWNRTYGTP
jgi:hypothetical protein